MIKFISLLLLFLTIIILITGCGNRKAVTGGPIDNEKPEIVSVIPEQYSNILNQNIEVTFSKAIDRASIYEGERGILFYPLIEEKRFRWSDHSLIIEINEELKPDQNYYLTLSEQIRDLRRNNLDQSYLFVFHTGELQNNRLFGNIQYELAQDLGKSVRVSILAADSLRIFSREFTGRNYALENLDNEDLIIRAFIDHNNNGRYDAGTEPFFETAFTPERNKELNISLEYFDETLPEIRTIRADYQHLLQITFNKSLASIGEIRINTADSLQSELFIRDYDIMDNILEIITNPMDSLKYDLTIRDVKDYKNNNAPELKRDFPGNTREDTTKPEIVSTSPRNGAVVDNLMPKLLINFNKFMTIDNIDLSLKDAITEETIPIKLQRNSSRQFTVQPEKSLTNRTPYRLEIYETSKDMIDNNIAEDYILQFLPISPDY